nr:reverse transcriptase domain-containing protein [Tanacetum cinerariifolium]
MQTRSSSNLPVESSPNPSTSNPKHHNLRRSKQPFILKESLVDTMVDQRTMTEWLRAPTEGYAEAIMVPSILAEQFELKHSLINMMTSDQFFGLEKDNPHDHIRCDANSSSSEIAKLTHAVNQQTSDVTTAMIAFLKQFQATLPPAFVKAVEEICVTCDGAHPYYQCLAVGGNTFLKLQDNIKGYVLAVAVNYNQVGESSPNPTTSNPKRRNRRRSKQHFSLEESPIDTMADQRTMVELLRAPTEGYAEVIVVPPILAEHFELKHSLINMMTSTPVATMTDNRTMAEMLRAPTDGCAEAIIVPPILAEQFELKHSLINMMTSEQFFGLEKDNPHDHVRWFNKITSTIKYKDIANSVMKLIFFPFLS